MEQSLQIRVFDGTRLLYSGELAGPVELGRQRRKEQTSLVPQLEAGHWRLSIARAEDQDVSRRHALVEPLADDRIYLSNVSDVQPIRFADGAELPPGAPRLEVVLPVELIFGSKRVVVEAPASAALMQSLAHFTCAPGAALGGIGRAAPLLPAGQIRLEEVLAWVQAVMGVLQSAAMSVDFFDRAAQAALELVKLDAGQVLLLEQDQWKVVSAYPPRGDAATGSPAYSLGILNRVRQEKKTFWQIPSDSGRQDASLRGVRAVVAAPILDRQGQVIGALYGDRLASDFALPSTPIAPVEAMLVELLAMGVATGLARLEQEQAALTAKVQFEQFFTPELARQLTIHPDLLKGRDVEVTLLFCDIRRFSHLCDRLGPARTLEWMSDVLGVLSDAVLAHRGVLVDYVGDELFAMWGAPETQPDHAALACRSALAMFEQLPELNRRWQSVLQEPIDLGIGINTGIARVGNTGSHRKFKYGPLGNSVNLASRVQGATKYLRVKLLTTEATRSALGAEFNARRLGAVRAVNIAEPVALYEIATPDQANWPMLHAKYEQALQEFERKEFQRVIRTLGDLLIDFPEDGPSVVLLSRAVGFLSRGPTDVDTVWELPGK